MKDKDLELLEKAFYAGRERISHPDFDYVYEEFSDWISNNSALDKIPNVIENEDKKEI